MSRFTLEYRDTLSNAHSFQFLSSLWVMVLVCSLWKLFRQSYRYLHRQSLQFLRQNHLQLLNFSACFSSQLSSDLSTLFLLHQYHLDAILHKHAISKWIDHTLCAFLPHEVYCKPASGHQSKSLASFCLLRQDFTLGRKTFPLLETYAQFVQRWPSYRARALHKDWWCVPNWWKKSFANLCQNLKRPFDRVYTTNSSLN